MLKQTKKVIIKNYLLFLITYLILAFISISVFDNKFALRKENLFIVFSGATIAFLIMFLITYIKNKDKQ